LLSLNENLFKKCNYQHNFNKKLKIMKTKILILFTSISLFLLACTKNPVTGKNEFQLVSEKIEISTGQEQYLYQQQAGGGTYVTDPDLVAYVNKVGQKLASVSDRPHLPYEFVILNNSIPNAWALPGGKIAIHRGLLVELHSEAELAAVLSHEIVHSAARHGAKAMERSLVLGAGLLGMGQVFNECKYEDLASAAALTGSQLIQFKYSREAELEADLYGIEYMFKAGYDLSASAELQKVFLNFSQDTNWLSGLFATHPPTKERLQRNF
jgi:beta-barrel assembly-enhancing protease